MQLAALNFTARTGLFVIALAVMSSAAWAHVSEQGLVLLLPTEFYITSGVLVVILTLALLLVLPAQISAQLFESISLAIRKPTDSADRMLTVTSLLSFAFLLVLLYLGVTGTRDPLENPLPLFIWTIWWIAVPIVQGVFGDIWRWINPWTGPYRVLKHTGMRSALTLPQSVGCWPGIAIFLLFSSFALADVAPDIPRRLSFFVGGYWLFTLVCMLLFGERWLKSGECFSMLMHRFAQLSVVGVDIRSWRYGLPGWKLKANKATSVSAAIFILILLGCGSFDGLNETFTWLAFIGVNPLEFPGRSAIIAETVSGLVATNLMLVLVYGICIYSGLQIARRCAEGDCKVTFGAAFCALAISVLPIAFAYHFAHYLVTFLINGQYAIASVSDPLSNGSDLLNLGPYFVSTGFMNTPASVKTIWLTQAAAVVLGHVVSVLLAHAVAVELFGNARRAIVSQAPLAVFMVVYTFIGLWLLAAPKGA